MSKAIRLSVMGAGLIGKRHIEQILARPEAGLASIIDPTSAARELAQSLNVAWYPFFQDIAPEDRPEGIIVATPNQMHVANGMECIEAGLPVLIEKPIADDLVGAEALVDSAERRGRTATRRTSSPARPNDPTRKGGNRQRSPWPDCFSARHVLADQTRRLF